MTVFLNVIVRSIAKTQIEVVIMAVNDTCMLDPTMSSIHIIGGVWNENNKNIFSQPLPRLQLQLAVIFALTQSLHLLLKQLHLPRICSEILVLSRKNLQFFSICCCYQQFNVLYLLLVLRLELSYRDTYINPKQKRKG